MNDSSERLDALIQSDTRRPIGFHRRAFRAEVAIELRGGDARQAERRFGWGRATVQTGLHGRRTGLRCAKDFVAWGRRWVDDETRRLAADIREIVEPHAYANPSLKSSRRYSYLSAAEVSEALIKTGHPQADLPAERTIRNVLDRMSDRLERLRKGRSSKRTKGTDAISADVAAVRQEARDDPGTLETSMDTKANVAPDDYVQERKGPDVIQRWGDRAPGSRPDREGETNAVWGPDARDRCVDAGVRLARRAMHGHVKRLVIDLGNGPRNSGRRTQFLRRMAEFVDR